MNQDPASLDNLRDIAVPAPVPWWPPAPGWWVVMAALAIAFILIVFRAWRYWRANAYRRAALRELQRATTATGIARILKRTALAAHPRTDIAALSGSAWCQWLGKSGRKPVPDKVAEALTTGVFDRVETANVAELTTFAADWILHHKNQPDGRKNQAKIGKSRS
jgi:hypothetical protein